MITHIYRRESRYNQAS